VADENDKAEVRKDDNGNVTVRPFGMDINSKAELRRREREDANENTQER